MHWIIQVEAKGKLRKIRNTALLQQRSHSKVLHSWEEGPLTEKSIYHTKSNHPKFNALFKLDLQSMTLGVQVDSIFPCLSTMRRCNAITPFLRWHRGVLPSSDLEMPPCMVFNPVTAAPVKRLRSAGRGKCIVETLQERTNGTASVPCPCREHRGWWAGNVQRVTEIYAGEVGIVVQLYMQT